MRGLIIHVMRIIGKKRTTDISKKGRDAVRNRRRHTIAKVDCCLRSKMTERFLESMNELGDGGIAQLVHFVSRCGDKIPNE